MLFSKKRPESRNYCTNLAPSCSNGGFSDSYDGREGSADHVFVEAVQDVVVQIRGTGKDLRLPIGFGTAEHLFPLVVVDGVAEAVVVVVIVVGKDHACSKGKEHK